MPVPAERRRSWLGRQVGSMALAHVQVPNPMAIVRAASWHNVLHGLGVTLPLFVVHDLGLLLTAPRGPGSPVPWLVAIGAGSLLALTGGLRLRRSRQLNTGV